MKKYISLILVLLILLTLGGFPVESRAMQLGKNLFQNEKNTGSSQFFKGFNVQKSVTETTVPETKAAKSVTETTVPKTTEETRKNVCEDCGDKLSDCKVCKGTGDCEDCDKNHKHVCSSCDGDPACTKCNYGVCHKCKGEGYAYPMRECSTCSGRGICKRCDGSGSSGVTKYGNKRSCVSCKGKGICQRCDGAGQRRSYDTKCGSCKGKGICRYCNGSMIRCTKCENGYVSCPNDGECKSCDGTGKYCQSCLDRKKKDEETNYTYDPYDDFCYECAGTGKSKCWSCVTGSCTSCGGDGYFSSYAAGKIKKTDCASCTGGRCRKCGGTTRVDCPYC